MNRLATLDAALRVTANPTVEPLLGALLVDELSRRGGSPPVLPEMMAKAGEFCLATEVPALVAVYECFRQTNQEPALAAALDELLERTFRTCRGLERAHLLERIWAAMPYSMRAYGYLRTCCLDARFDDILRSYPDERVPEDDLAAWIFLAQVALRSGEHGEARNILSILDARHPGNPFVQELLANALIAGGDFATADAIYLRMAEHYAWPAGLIRLSDAHVGQHYASAEWDDPPERFEWLCRPPRLDATRLFVIGVDDRYAKRYLPGLLSSLARTYPQDGWRLHIHLINPAPETGDWIAGLRQSGTPLCATVERMAPRATETSDTRRIIETRTYYACARFRILPRLLEQYAQPLWIIDADMLARRPIDTLLAEAGDPAPHLGIIPLDGRARARCLYEEYYLSMSYYAPSPATLRFTRTLARQINHLLACDRWGWGLDQAAIFAVVAWFERHHPDFRIARIPRSFVSDIDKGHSDAYFHSLVGSVE
ncbi:MAG: outer membrane protein assembly factor BamD [Candidatus Accumulibacter sp.]|jgi:hypothetical protein|nr:outer membrane protein assembly factor BamD [Accumulibacter sp.]